MVDRIIGGWQVSGLARLQSGRLIDLGNVRLVGMSKDELQDLYKLRITPAGRVFTFPQETTDCRPQRPSPRMLSMQSKPSAGAM